MEVLDGNFDAQLVAVFNGPIGFEHGNGLSFCLHDGRVIPLDVTLAALRNLKRNRDDVRRRLLADAMFDAALDSDQVPKPAQEALKDGAVQLSCFLSSPGGSAQYIDDFKLTCAEILSRNGAVSTHGFEMIASAAAKIWAIADAERRFVLNGTQALWHTGEERESAGSPEMSGRKKEPEKLRIMRIEREKQEILNFFQGVPNDDLERIRRRVLDPENLRGEVYFTGSDLARMGLARSFPTREEGLAHFLSSSGLSDCGIQDSNSFKDLLATPRVNSLSGALQGILKKK